MRILTISPHSGDAVMSFGAGLARAARDGATVTVYTTFAGSATPPYSPAARRMHGIWGLAPEDDAALHRRREDIAALAHLGADHRHGRFLDAIYRRLPDGRWLAGHVEGRKKLAFNERPPDDDRDLVAGIKDDLGSLIGELDPTLIVTCAAVGGHSDHLATRDAALFAAYERGVPVRLWEDLPYALFRPDTVELPQGFRRGSPEAGPAGEEPRARKLRAVASYSSQVTMFDGRDGGFLDRLAAHGETTWPVVRGSAPGAATGEPEVSARTHS